MLDHCESELNLLSNSTADLQYHFCAENYCTTGWLSLPYGSSLLLDGIWFELLSGRTDRSYIDQPVVEHTVSLYVHAVFVAKFEICYVILFFAVIHHLLLTFTMLHLNSWGLRTSTDLTGI